MPGWAMDPRVATQGTLVPIIKQRMLRPHRRALRLRQTAAMNSTTLANPTDWLFCPLAVAPGSVHSADLHTHARGIGLYRAGSEESMAANAAPWVSRLALPHHGSQNKPRRPSTNRSSCSICIFRIGSISAERSYAARREGRAGLQKPHRAQARPLLSKEHLRALVKAAVAFDETGMAAALVSLLLFGGLRSSELRGARVVDVKFPTSSFQVCQAADRWQQLGPVKTRNARRTIPLPDHTITALRRWIKKAPLSSEGLLFGNGVGKVESYANLYHRLWVPLMDKAKLATEDGVPLFGMHALCHAAVSLWIESGAMPKKVMTWAGHSSIQFTMDTYGHLWADAAGDAAIAAAVERSVLSKG